MTRVYYLTLFLLWLTITSLQGQIFPPFLDAEQTLIEHKELTMIKVEQTMKGLPDAVPAKPVIHKIDRTKRVVSGFALDDQGELMLTTTAAYDDQWRVLSRRSHNQEDGLGYKEDYQYHENGTIEKWIKHQWRSKIEPETIHTFDNHLIFYYDEDCKLLRSEATGVRQNAAFNRKTEFVYSFDEEGRKTEEIALASTDGEEEFTPSVINRWQYKNNRIRYTYRFGQEGRIYRQDTWYEAGLLVKSKWHGHLAKRNCRFTYKDGLRTEMYMLSSNPVRKIETRITYTYFYE
jgi:hypothetical protein